MPAFRPHVIKRDNGDVCLIGIDKDSYLPSGTITDLPLYNGKSFYSTDHKILIDVGYIDGKPEHITCIEQCSLSKFVNIQDIYISYHIKRIEWNVYGCHQLQNIFVDKRNKYFTDVDGVLFTLNEGQVRKIVGFPSGRRGFYAIPDGVTEICNFAFKDCRLSCINIPETVEIIGINVFYNCFNLTDIILPKNLKVFKSNKDIHRDALPQKFYLWDDVDKINPLSAEQVEKLFPEEKR